MGSLEGTTIVILGASSGMGLETAREAVSEGANVVIGARDYARLAIAQEELGPTARSFVTDGTDPDAIAKLFDGIGTIDHIFTTVGGSPPGGDQAENDLVE